jgi:hypothetical protein
MSFRRWHSCSSSSRNFVVVAGWMGRCTEQQISGNEAIRLDVAAMFPFCEDGGRSCLCACGSGTLAWRMLICYQVTPYCFTYVFNMPTLWRWWSTFHLQGTLRDIVRGIAVRYPTSSHSIVPVLTHLFNQFHLSSGLSCYMLVALARAACFIKFFVNSIFLAHKLFCIILLAPAWARYVFVIVSRFLLACFIEFC